MKGKPIITITAIIAMLTPYISVVSGGVASWLFVHFHWLGFFHITSSQAAQTVAGAVVFTVTSVLTYAAAHFHWLPIVIKNVEARRAVTPSSGGSKQIH